MHQVHTAHRAARRDRDAVNHVVLVMSQDFRNRYQADIQLAPVHPVGQAGRLAEGKIFQAIHQRPRVEIRDAADPPTQATPPSLPAPG